MRNKKEKREEKMDESQIRRRRKLWRWEKEVIKE